MENRLEGFDIIRGFAAIMIVICHTIQPFGDSMRNLSGYFSGFIDVFFILSALLLGIQLKNKKLGLFFLKKRFIRLGITYYPFLIILIIILLLLGYNLKIFDVVSHFLFIHWLFNQDLVMAHHLWYLTMICLCYIAVAILSRFSKHRLTFSLLFSVLLFLFLIKINLPPRIAVTTLTYILFYFYAEKIIAYIAQLNSRTVIFFLLINIAVLLLIGFNIKPNKYIAYPLNILVSVSYIALFYKCIRKDFTGILNFTSSISFELYLVHYPVLFLLSTYFGKFRCTFWGLFPAFIIIVVASYLLSKFSLSLKGIRNKSFK